MADVMSVVSPSGASHAIAASPRALAVLALAGAVPGTPALTFMLGVGDLVIAALLTSAAARFALSPRRVLAGCFVGLAVAFVLAAVLGAPIPALVGLAIAGALAEPAFRRVPKKDRNAAVIAMVVSAGLAAFVLLRR
ncbi:MAG: hypothetical protein U0271_44405 [Polyangiaceae bacterium]